MARKLGILASLCILAGFWLLFLKPELTITGPKLQALQFSTTDLGTGAPGNELTGKLVLHNSGDEPLVFSTKLGCGCLKLVPHSGSIPAHSSQQFVAIIRLRERGKDEAVTATFTTNDSSSPIFTHQFRAKCPAPFKCDRSFIDFGQIERTQAAISKIAINRSNGRGPKDLRIESSSSKLILSTTTTGDTDTITVNLSEELKGSFNEYIRFTMDDYSYKLPVSGMLFDHWQVLPNHILMKDLNPGNTASFVVRSLKPNNLKGLVVLKTSDWLGCTLDTQESGLIIKGTIRILRPPTSLDDVGRVIISDGAGREHTVDVECLHLD